MFATMRFPALLTLVVFIGIFLSAQTQSAPTDESKPPSPAKLGNGVSPPKVLYHPDPEYSEKARRAKFQGVCVLWLVVGTDGVPHDIKVARPLGMGLDEKAIEAIRQWKFEPAQKDGQPVAVQINVEVAFRLYDTPTSSKVRKLEQSAYTSDPSANVKLAEEYLKSGDTYSGTRLLEQVARQGSPRAQYLLAQQLTKPDDQGNVDYVSAYLWYSIAKRSGYKFNDRVMRELETKLSAQQLADARARIAAYSPPATK